MSRNGLRVIRDALITQISRRMADNKEIIFLSADFGSPALDALRADFSDRFINVGIAEQNLINVATGLALEGFVVYAYGIAPFITMRAYEQIRINLSLLSHTREVNVNLIGVGAGLSYDFTGPTHHCLEDLGIMRLLPNVCLLCPSDSATAEALVDYTIDMHKPKYLRLEGKALPDIEYAGTIDTGLGFRQVRPGQQLCLVATGYMTHKALRVSEELRNRGMDVAVIDVFMIKPLDEKGLAQALKPYRSICCMEEAFAAGGGLGSLVTDVVHDNGLKVSVHKFAFQDEYCFEIGDREFLHSRNGLGHAQIINRVMNIMAGTGR